VVGKAIEEVSPAVRVFVPEVDHDRTWEIRDSVIEDGEEIFVFDTGCDEVTHGAVQPLV
jgi:hypothetical protein